MGIIMAGIKFMWLHNNNSFKLLSLEDNVYFTLRDIFSNADSFEDIITTNDFNFKLSGDIRYEDRDETFEYTRVLYDIKFLDSLINWLNSLKDYSFNFDEDEDESEEEVEGYMQFDDWWLQFENLKQSLHTLKVSLTQQ